MVICPVFFILKLQFFTMKQVTLVIILCFQGIIANAQDIIPQPVSVRPLPGIFSLKNNYFIGLSNQDGESKKVAEYLSKKILTASGFNSTVGLNRKDATIALRIASS